MVKTIAKLKFSRDANVRNDTCLLAITWETTIHGKLIRSDTATENNTPESSSEILIEYSVDDRIQSRVDIAKPEGEGETPRLNVARRTQRRQQIKEEER